MGTCKVTVYVVCIQKADIWALAKLWCVVCIQNADIWGLAKLWYVVCIQKADIWGLAKLWCVVCIQKADIWGLAKSWCVLFAFRKLTFGDWVKKLWLLLIISTTGYICQSLSSSMLQLSSRRMANLTFVFWMVSTKQPNKRISAGYNVALLN